MIFYQMVTIYKFIDSAKNINIAIINDTLEKIRNQNPGEKSYPDPIEENLEIITNLYRNDCIDRKLIEPNINIMKNHSEYFDLYFLVEDINLTDIKLISTLNEKKINEIMSNKSLKNKVYKLLENEIILENDKKVVDKFYIRKFDI
ncbi:hypothetical protein BW42_00001 [Exiguobacterium sp. RIT341]|nr:hypothetical protein BW42_00001 [Exiguobacterium sp. RIT341]